MLADSKAKVHLVREYKGLHIYRFLNEEVKLSHTEDDMSFRKMETVANDTSNTSYLPNDNSGGMKTMQLI